MSATTDKISHLTSPIPIKLAKKMRRDLASVAKASGLRLPDVMRLSITRGLPIVKEQLLGKSTEAKAA